MRPRAHCLPLIGLAASAVAGVTLAGGIAGAAQITLTPTGPSPATVTAAVGEAVTFVNGDAVPHTVTSAKGGYSSGVIPPGGSFTWSFSGAGSYFYRDLGHRPAARGRVRVTAPAILAPTIARPALTLRAARAMAVSGQQTALVGVAAPPVPALELQLRTPDGWSNVAPVIPTADGSFRTVVVAQSAGAYRVATPNHHSSSAVVMVHVQPRVELRAKRQRALAGTELRFAVRASPAGVRIAELRSWNARTGTWRRLTGARVGADGQVTLRWHVKAGRNWVRATIPPQRGELKLATASSLAILVVGTPSPEAGGR